MKAVHKIVISLMIASLSVVFLAASEKKLKILEISWTEHGAVEEAFRKTLQQMGYKVEYVEYSAKQDRSKLAQFLREQKSQIESFDYVYTFGTTVSLTVKTFLNGRVPQLFNAVTDPVGSGLVNSLARPGGNLSGFSDGISVEAQLSHVKKRIEIKSLAFVFNPKEQNSNLERRKVIKYCSDFGIKYSDIRISATKSRYKETLRKIGRNHWKVDLAILPQDSFIATNQVEIVSAFIKAKIPTLGTQPDYHNAGATFTMSADYGKGGNELAKILDKHEQGVPLGQIPVKTVETPVILRNK